MDSSGTNEGWKASGVVAKICVGVSVAMTGIVGMTSAPARWQSTQWLHPWPNAIFPDTALPWQGMTDASSSALKAEIDADATLIDPCNGMTASSAPAAGNQTIIQISRSFLKNFMFIRDKLSAD